MNMPKNFCGLWPSLSDYKKAKAAVLPVPYEGTVTYGRGTSKGPKAIIEASWNMELYDEELDKSPCEAGISTLPELNVRKDKPEAMIKKLYVAVKKIASDKKFPVIVGGEHSISSATVKALHEVYTDLSVLQLDAHTDFREEYENSKYSHASVMARIKDICPIVSVGIRSCDESELGIIKKLNHVFWAKDMWNNETWMDEAVDRLSKNVFITFDIDALDPGIMPSTGTPEPGGLQWYTALKFLKKVFVEKNVVGFDVVELAPIKGLHAPDFLTAKLIYKMIGYKYFL